MTTDERGVSEVLSYILVFSVVAVTIAFVLGDGLGAVSTTQQNARIDAAQSGVAILDKGIEAVYQTGVPRRATELKPNGGTLSVGDRLDIDLAVSQGGTDLFEYGSASSRFTHTIDDQSVGLALGARFRSGSGGVAMTAGPPFHFGDERTSLPVVLLTGADSVSTGSPVQIVASSQNEELLDHRTAGPGSGTPYTVEIAIETTPERAAAWNRYFQREGLTAVDDDPTDGIVVYSHETRRLIIEEFTMGLELR